VTAASGAELLGGTPGRSLSWLEPDGVDRWRVVEGRERGELLRAVRGDDGTITKLYLATYPLTREPATFGQGRGYPLPAT